jgi:hypothetical protein
MLVSDYIKTYDDVLSSEMCDDFIKLFQQQELIVRSCENYKFDELNIEEHQAYTHHMDAFYDTCESIKNRYYIDCKIQYSPNIYGYEPARIKRYINDGNQEFKSHIDNYDINSARRFLVMFYYLNDVQDGGETEFLGDLNIKVKPKKGSIVIFPPNFMYPHKANKPISNNKYIVSTYLTYL